MKKQAYKIKKSDWYVSVEDANGYYDGYFRTKAKAIKFMKNQPGIRQLFKVSYEFRDVMV